MKIIAFNSSPRGGGQSKTELMLDALVEGMREAGADVDVVALRKKTIRYCSGCFTCWTKTPGVCIHKDDMKAFIERTLPVLQPFFETRAGETVHPPRYPLPKTVILSVAGFPEASIFDQLSSWARFVFGRNDKLVAEIYRPAAESLTQAFLKDKAREILEATRQAGREIVANLKVSPETLARVTQDIVGDTHMMARMANMFWKTCIAEGVSPREFDEKGLVPRPDSIETFMWLTAMGFNPKGAGDTTAVLEFNFTGTVAGSCHFRIETRQNNRGQTGTVSYLVSVQKRRILVPGKARMRLQPEE
ncbi:MAG: flavodoxin family protein [Pseudomonadota bacterium]